MSEINHVVGALIIFIIALLVICLCTISLKIIWKTAILHNAFGIICGTQSFAEAVVASCFAFWAAPMLMFNSPLSTTTLGIVIGNIIIFFYFLSGFLHLCKSVNRCYAIIFPIHYHSNFTLKAAKILIAFIMLLTLLSISSSFLYPCNYFFDPSIFSWKSRSDECFNSVAFYTGLIIRVTTIIGSVVCDIITLCYLIMFNKKIKQQHGPSLYNEKKFFAQTFLTTFMYSTSASLMYVMHNYIDPFTANFWFGSVNWLLSLLFNELLFIAFSVKMKDFTKRFSIFSLSSRFKVGAVNDTP